MPRYASANAIKKLYNIIVELLNKKSDSGHNHDDRYYTETEVNDFLNEKVNSSRISYGTSNPSGGEDGDIYFKYS